MGRGNSSAGSVIEIPRLIDPGSATVDERDDHLMLLEAARHLLEVEWTETLAVADEAGDHHVMGFPSMIAYLKHRMRMGGGRAHRYVKRARASSTNAATFAAWKLRQISSDEVDLLFETAARMPDVYADAEVTLLEIVGDSFEETKRILDYWAAGTDERRLELEAQLQRRHCHVTRRNNGMVAGRFALPELAGESLLAALEALMPAPAESDIRSVEQRRADALEDLARAFLDGSETPVVGGEKPHVNVHVDFDALAGDAGGLHETGDGHVLDPDSVRQLACDASVTRIVFGSDSEVLDVGRKTRTIPSGLRRAVVARDRHCVAPGCGRSASWCDVHHRISWADGGETEIDNLCLLCRYHHTLVHLELLDLTELRSPVPAGSGRRRSI